MDERPEDEALRETIAQVADTWHLFPEPGVLTTGGLSRAEDGRQADRPAPVVHKRERGKKYRP